MDPPETRACSPPSLGPSEVPSPRGSWEAALPPSAAALPAPAATVSEWEAAQHGSGTKGPLSPPRSGGAGSGGRGRLRSPQRRGCCGGRPAGSGAPGEGQADGRAARDAGGPELSRELPPASCEQPARDREPAAPPGPQRHHSSAPTGGLVSVPHRAEPRRAASRSPSTHRQRPAGHRLPPPAPFP